MACLDLLMCSYAFPSSCVHFTDTDMLILLVALNACVKHKDSTAHYMVEKHESVVMRCLYRYRLAMSAFDLAETHSKGVTVGFSGTKDYHLLLPLQVCMKRIPLFGIVCACVTDLLCTRDYSVVHA